jgi:LPXTG-motif cell wall-anchored protein
VTQTVKLPSKGSWSTTIKNLIRKDTEGYYYKYYITEDSCSPSGYTFTYTDDLGKDADHAITEDGKTVEVTNKDELTEASVTKVWKDQNGDNKEWDPNVDTITLHLTRMRGNEQDATFGNAGVVDVIAASDEVRNISPALAGVTGTVTLKTAGKPSDGYVVKLQGLEKYYNSEDGRHEYTYLFSEKTVESYHEPMYTEMSGTNNTTGKVASGGSIINTPEDAYSLPQTGGMGTRVFYLLGMCLVISAFMLLFKVKAAR